ncbi:MAG: hypothetical protein QOD77_631 [Thermoplasmata archaeon]|nr:hypothetical protein [Thermoplasmata archaeon]
MTTAAAWRRPALQPYYFGLACLLVLAIVVQVYLAGLTVLYEYDTYAPAHRGLSHVLELAPILLVVLGLVGGAPKPVTWAPLGLVVLVGLQHATIAAVGSPLRALHAVNALLILAAAAWLAYASRPTRA